MDIQNSIIELLKENLSKALKNTGKSAKEIAKLTGLKYSAVSGYMRGATFPYIATFDLLIKKLGLDEKEIMRYDLANDIIDSQIINIHQPSWWFFFFGRSP